MARYDFSRTIFVPQGRTYIFREFRFLPSTVIFQNSGGTFIPFPNFYEWRWLVSNILQGDTVAPNAVATSPVNTFSGAGSLGWMESFFMAPQNSVVTLQVQTYDIPDAESPGVTLNAIVDVRVNSLLDDARPLQFQAGNRFDELDIARINAAQVETIRMRQRT